MAAALTLAAAITSPVRQAVPAPVQLFYCSALNPLQQWTFSEAEKTFTDAESLCMGANASGWVWTAPCTGEVHQQWSFGPNATIVNGGGQCLNVNANDKDPGALLITFPCVGSQNEGFVYTPATGQLLGNQSGLCVDAGSARTSTCGMLPFASFDYCNTSLTLPARVADLISRMEPADVYRQMQSTMQSVNYLGVPSATFWNEATHGITQRGPFLTTQFPMPSLTACSFNRTLISSLANATGVEGRAISNMGGASNFFWAPNVNLVRDPRWGRAQEVPGEDPYLAAQWAKLYVRGMQVGEDPRYLRVGSTCKHAFAYNFEGSFGANITRFNFNAPVSAQDLADTYLIPFQGCVEDGGPSGVMCSYTSVNGVPSCANGWLLTSLVQAEWGCGDCYATGDCGAVQGVQDDHHYSASNSSTAAAVLGAGVTMDCGGRLPGWLPGAVADGSVAAGTVEAALARSLAARFRTGEFDWPAAASPYTAYGPGDVCTPGHVALALEAAQQGTVLLKNAAACARCGGGQALPLALPLQQHSIALVGPNANNSRAQLCSYYNDPGPCGGWDAVSTPLAALPAYAAPGGFTFAPGCADVFCSSDAGFGAAVAAAASASLTVVAVGISAEVAQEGEDRGDDIGLPGQQDALVAAVCAASRGPCVVAVMSGSSLDVGAALADPAVDALLFVGYGGPAAGEALGRALYLRGSDGAPAPAAAPAGRLTQTWFSRGFSGEVSVRELGMRPGASPLAPYTNPGHTHRFYVGNHTLLPFGYGLSYSNLSYSALAVAVRDTSDAAAAPAAAGGGGSAARVSLRVTRAYLAAHANRSMPPQSSDSAVDYWVNVTNTGSIDTDDVVLGFLVPPGAGTNGVPLQELFGFERVFVPAGATVTVYLGLPAHRLAQARPGDAATAARDDSDPQRVGAPAVPARRVPWPGRYTVRFGVEQRPLLAATPTLQHSFVAA